MLSTTKDLRSAIISPCETYRYNLARVWGEGSHITWVMLNPSKADALIDDQTIRKCIGFARRLGHAGIDVVNVYAYRATDPDDLYEAERRGTNIIGPENDRYVGEAFARAAVVVCAWGANKVSRGRRDFVASHAEAAGKPLWCIGLTDKGAPRHPCMAPYVDALLPYPVPS